MEVFLAGLTHEEIISSVNLHALLKTYPESIFTMAVKSFTKVKIPSSVSFVVPLLNCFKSCGFDREKFPVPENSQSKCSQKGTDNALTKYLPQDLFISPTRRRRSSHLNKYRSINSK